MKKMIYVKHTEAGIEFTLFPNEKKEGNQPDYRSNGGFAAWIREYEEKPKEVKKSADI